MTAIDGGQDGLLHRRRLHRSSAKRRSRTTGPTRGGSRWPTSSSAPCTARRGSSTCGRSPHSRIVSSTTAVRDSWGSGNASSATIRSRRRSPSGSSRATSRSRSFELEDEGADGAAQLPQYWEQRWPCTDVAVLPDRLDAAGISWKEYRGRERVGAAAAHGPARPIQRDVEERRDVQGVRRRPRTPGNCPRCRGSRLRSRCRITRRKACVRVRTGPSRLLNAADAEPGVELDGGRADVGRLRRATTITCRRRTSTCTASARACRRSSCRPTRGRGTSTTHDGVRLGAAVDRDRVRRATADSRDANTNDMLSAFDFTQQPLDPLVLTPRTARRHRSSSVPDRRG